MEHTKPLSYEPFKHLILKLVTKAAGPDAAVTLRQVAKNNGTALDGLEIRLREEAAAPVVYLGEYYDACLGGASPAAIAAQILAKAADARREAPSGISALTDFAKVKGRVIFRLVGRERNAALLESVPHKDFLDLAVTFHVLLDSRDGMDATLLVRSEFLPMWGTDADELFGLAKRNTPRLLGWELTDMAEILAGLSGTEGETVPPGAPAFPMHVLTSRTKLHGAAAVLCDGVLGHISEELGGNFYILPSSVHEVIIVPDTDACDPGRLSRMVREVNGTQVPEGEVLADHAYYYDAAADEITIPQEAAEKPAA